MKLSDLLRAEIDSVKIEMDSNGHYRVTFSDEELRKINLHLKAQLDTTYEDWTPIWNEAVENQETYRTVKIPIPDGGQSVYPAPIARIPADQIISSIYNAVMRPRPIFSVDAYLNAHYPVASAQPTPNTVMAEQVSSEIVAHRMEQGYDFIMRERIGFGQLFMKGVTEAVKGSPFWWKVVACPSQKTALTPKVEGALIDLTDKQETKTNGDIVRWFLVPFTNCMYPLDAESIDSAEWFAERMPMLPDEVAKRIVTKEFFLIEDEAKATSLVTNTIDRNDEFKVRVQQSTEKKIVTAPEQVCDNWLVWFDRNVRYLDPEQPTDPISGEKIWRIKKLRFVSNFHRTAGEMMDCHLNDYEHQQTPYELVDQMDNGDCTVGRMKYHQTMFTYAGQSEIKSAHIANNLNYWYDPNQPEIADFFGSHRVIEMGQHIPGVKDKDWGTVTMGEKHYSMLDLMKFYLSMSQLDSRENDFTMGGRPPGRTSPNTVKQVYEHAEETKAMFLARLSSKFSRLLRLDAETRRQYQPMGEILPAWDAEAKAAIEIPFRFPIGDVMDNFRFALTAADEALTAERDPQQIMMRKTALMQDGEYVAKVIAAIINIQQPLPPSAVSLFAKVMTRDQQALRQLMGQQVTDEESYDLTPEIEAVIRERNDALQKQMMQPPQIGGQLAPSPSGPQPPAPGPPAGAGPTQRTAPQAPGQRPVPAPTPQAPAPVPGTPPGSPVQ